MTAELVLHDYWRSSSAYRLRIALNLMGLDYRTVPVDLVAGDQVSAGHLALNPQGLVPVLAIDGLHLTQSLAILEYLDETRAAGFLPQDAAGRARVRALAHAVAMEIQPVANLRVMKAAVAASGGALTPGAWMQQHIAPGLAAVERLLDHPATGKFCHGDRLGLADICLLPQVYNARRWQVDLAPCPKVVEITARMEADPRVAAAAPQDPAAATG